MLILLIFTPTNFIEAHQPTVCHPRNLQVPEAIHEQWKKGGASRTALQQMFQEAGFNKDPGGCVGNNQFLMVMHPFFADVSNSISPFFSP